MQLTSVNVARARRMAGGRGPLTGIYKAPVGGPVSVGELGLEGDAICSKKHHGGPDQAVYVYGAPDYAWWAQQLAREIAPGTFGENLTVDGLESAALRVGDRIRVGPVVLEVTGPRIPCGTLARRMADEGFGRVFKAAERPGVYCRVLQVGTVEAGMPVSLEPFTGETVSGLEVFRDFYAPELTEASIRRILAAPIAIRYRAHKEKQLAEVLAERKLVGSAA